jgi:hypothetical protein
MSFWGKLESLLETVDAKAEAAVVQRPPRPVAGASAEALPAGQASAVWHSDHTLAEVGGLRGQATTSAELAGGGSGSNGWRAAGGAHAAREPFPAQAARLPQLAIVGDAAVASAHAGRSRSAVAASQPTDNGAGWHSVGSSAVASRPRTASSGSHGAIVIAGRAAPTATDHSAPAAPAVSAPEWADGASAAVLVGPAQASLQAPAVVSTPHSAPAPPRDAVQLEVPMAMSGATASAAAHSLRDSAGAHAGMADAQLTVSSLRSHDDLVARLTNELATADAARHRTAQEAQHLGRELDASRAEAHRYHTELERGRKREATLEAQIKDAYAEVSAARAQIDSLKHAFAECDTTVVDATRGELEAAQQNLATLHSELADFKAAAARSTATLRAELARAEAAAESAVAEALAIRRAAARREEELAGEVAELSNALSAAQRALDDRARSVRSEQVADGDREMEAHLRQQAAAAAEAAILSERRQCATLRADVEATQHQLAATRGIVESLQRDVAQARAERDEAKVAEAEATKAAAGIRKQLTAAGSQPTEQLMALTERLVRQEQELDSARASLNAARAALQREKEAHAVTRAALSTVEAELADDTPSVDGGRNVEEGVSLASVWSDKTTRRVGARDRTARAGRPHRVALTPFTDIRSVGGNRRVAAAADTLDSFFMSTGRLLFGSPVARLVFLMYLALLHLWSLFILLFHTHSLPHDNHSPMGRRPMA